MTTNTPAAGEMPVELLLPGIFAGDLAMFPSPEGRYVRKSDHDRVIAAKDAEIARLQAERPSNAVLMPADKLRELQADARRYQWLRSTTNTFTNDSGERIDVKMNPQQWDAAIDAASQPMGNGGEHG